MCGQRPQAGAGGAATADAPASRPLASVIGGQYTGGKARWAPLATKFTPMRASAGWPALTMRLVLLALLNPPVALDPLRLPWSLPARGLDRRPPFPPPPPRHHVRGRLVT